MAGRVLMAARWVVGHENGNHAATLGGASAMGRDDLGRLAPGARADLIVVDLTAPSMGQVIDPIQTLLLNAWGREVRTVVINGDS